MKGWEFELWGDVVKPLRVRPQKGNAKVGVSKDSWRSGQGTEEPRTRKISSVHIYLNHHEGKSRLWR